MHPKERGQSNPDIKPLYAKERPDFGPSQVCEPEELVVGRRYIIHRQWFGGKRDLIPPQHAEVEIAETPSRLPEKGESEPRLKTWAIYRDEQKSVAIHAFALRDIGLIDQNGWHQYSWVEDPSKRPTAQSPQG